MTPDDKPPRDSKTLSDIVVGDMVWVLNSDAGPSLMHVDRMTKTLIVIGSMRFRRTPMRAGERDGTWPGQGIKPHEDFTIATGATKNRVVMSWHRRKWPRTLNDPDQGFITSMRDACDAAESTLRGLGQWKDEES